MVYDADSGLVYSETTISAKACDCLSLHRSDGAQFIRSATAAHGQGALKLHATVTTHILRNLKGLRAAAVASSLGSHPLLVDKLWVEIKNSSLDTLHAWQTFVQIKDVDVDQVRYWKWHCARCWSFGVPKLLELADSHSFAWLTDVTLDDRIPSHDLIQVSELRNLRNLHLQGSTRLNEGITDPVFRAWADAARHEHAFPMLKAISIDSSRLGGRSLSNITHWSLGQMWKFPSLALFRISGFRFESKYTTDQQRIGSFVRRRARSRSRSQDLGDGYVLELQIGVPRPQRAFHEDDVVCFERDWTSWVPTAEETAPWISQAEAADAPPGSKRRKVKDGRSRQLAGFMDGLI
ncbi:hypothetical protein LTR36_007678 [Oleoguttula mirabilis]|uniref:Uncharacterized protein n=1 Tax=Oleoguttula mirabilis TaxID=1507867 RepID=A0AAV9JUI3_9PEZI|nr:hypothetical protein LTR36_007678 [Oleoguttula mirabilis]